MADFTSRGKRDEPGDENAGGEYVLVGSKMVTRDPETKVLHTYKRGDKVTLSDEQAQRLRAGKPGSTFQKEADVEPEVEMEGVAVANEATLPAEADGYQTSPERTRNRRVPATKLPEADPEKATREDREVETESPAPVTSTRPGKAAK